MAWLNLARERERRKEKEQRGKTEEGNEKGHKKQRENSLCQTSPLARKEMSKFQPEHANRSRGETCQWRRRAHPWMLADSGS